MRLGIQIGVAGQPNAQAAIAAVGKMGLAGIEVFDWDIGGHYEKPEVFKGWLDDAGIALSGAYFSSDKFIDPAGEEEVLQKARDASAFLARMGKPFLVVNGGSGRGERESYTAAEFAQLAKVANAIGAIARQAGIAAVMHPHYKCMIETCADVDALLANGLDKNAIGLCVHSGHQLVKGTDPYEMYEKHGNWVRYAHISDHQNAKGDGAFIGEGILDQKRLMKPLLDGGFDGWIIIESRKEGVSPAEYAARTRDYLVSQFPTVNWE